MQQSLDLLSLGPVQKLIRVLPWQEGVIPLRQHAVFAQAQLFHLCVGDLEAGGIVLRDQMAGDAESCGGRGFADELGDQRIGLERDTRPVLTDLAEESMLDRIPLGGPRGIVADGDRQMAAVHEVFLQRPLPGATLIAVAATAIGEDE